MNFKKNFKTILMNSGIKVKDISALTKISPQTLYNYLRPKGNAPSLVNGIKIARALSVSVEYLVFGNDQNETKFDIDLRTINTLAGKLTNKQKKLAIEFLKTLMQRRDIE